MTDDEPAAGTVWLCDDPACPGLDEDPDDAYTDEGGTYHRTCHEVYMDREINAYWAEHGGRHRTPMLSEDDIALGYEPNDPKNPRYIEALIDHVDSERG